MSFNLQAILSKVNYIGLIRFRFHVVRLYWSAMLLICIMFSVRHY
jgi:hypothetical protein